MRVAYALFSSELSDRVTISQNMSSDFRIFRLSTGLRPDFGNLRLFRIYYKIESFPDSFFITKLQKYNIVVFII